MQNIRGRVASLGKLSSRSMLVLATIAGTVAVYTWQLSGLTAGISRTEQYAATTSSSLQALSENPLNLPHSGLLYLFQKFGLDGLVSLRAVSVIWALIFIYCFYKIMRIWFGNFIAWLSTLLLATTPLVILTGRSMTPDIMLLMPVALTAVYYWLSRSEKFSKPAFVSLLGLSALSLYIPGMVWFLLVAAVVVRPTIKKSFGLAPRWLIAAVAALWLIVLTPLVAAIASDLSLLTDWALLPPNLPDLIEAAKNLAWMALGLFWHTGTHSDFQIGRLPLLNITQLALVFFGAYALWVRARTKAYSLAAAVGIAVLFAGINARFSLLLIGLPAVLTYAAAGLRYLHLEWNGVFPLNPIPRVLAIILMCALVFMNVLFGVRYSLVAWPHTVDTKQTYVLK